MVDVTTLLRKEIWITQTERIFDLYRIRPSMIERTLKSIIDNIERLNQENKYRIGYPIFLDMINQGIKIYHFVPDIDGKDKEELLGLLSSGIHVGGEPNHTYFSTFHSDPKFPRTNISLIDLVREFI